MAEIYPKIPGPFKREQEKPFLLTDTWSSPELKYLADNNWVWTEKIDGTNVRIIWDGYNITFGGRTDKAQMPKTLTATLEQLFPDGADTVFEQLWGDTPAVLFGEGYGPGIQKGGWYRDNVGFALFDVKVGDWWLSQDDVADVAKTWNLETVPYVFTDTVHEAIYQIQLGHRSYYDDSRLAEGMVGVPTVPLFGKRGNRIMVKVKAVDFGPEA